MQHTEMDIDSIKFTLNTEVILYGAGEVGVNLACKLMLKNYQVKCFWDQRGTGNVEGKTKLPIYSNPQDIRRIASTDSVVIVCLANGNLHFSVAEMIFTQGYSYIVFLPLMLPMSMGEKTKLISEYDAILRGDCANIEVCNYGLYHRTKLNCEQIIYKTDDKMVWTYIPLELLYTENFDNWKGDKQKVTGMPETFDKNILCQKWYRHLFRYFKGYEQSPDYYFKGFKIAYSKEEKEQRLLDRELLNNIFENEYKRGMDFFENTAPLVEWNANGYFNLVGGHHRTIFLLEKGHDSFPVRMTREDFDKWSHVDVLKNGWMDLLAMKNGVMEVPIPHPQFLNIVSLRVTGLNRILEKVFLFMDDRELKINHVMDASCADGFFARNMKRMKAQNVDCFDEDTKRLTGLFDLLSMEPILVYDDISQFKGQSFDAVFIINPRNGWNILNEIDCVIDHTDLVFYEYEISREREMVGCFDKRGFRESVLLTTEVYACQRYAVVAFMREEKTN